MLVAPQRREKEIYQKPRRNYQTKNVREPKRKLKKVAVTLVLVAFGTGLFLASETTRLEAKGYRIVQLKEDILQLKTRNERLKLKIAELHSLDRIEKVAKTHLHMKYPEASDLLLVESVAGKQYVKKDNEDVMLPPENLVFHTGFPKSEVISSIFSSIIQIFGGKAVAGL